MALKKNIIYIYFKGKHLVTSKSQYQYNHGQFLYFADLDLPQAFEVHFSNKDKGESKTQIGSDKLVEIPDEYFWNGALQIYAWIYLHNGTDDGETIYEVRIPLIKRAKPTDEEPLPVQQSTIDKAIAELATAVNITNENADKTELDKNTVASLKDEVVTLKGEIDSTATTVNQKAQEAVNAAGRSEASAQNAAGFENSAKNYSQQAEQSAQSALESKNIAQQKSEVATNASNEALSYRNEALEAKNQAVQAKQNIVDYRDETKGYRDETLSAKNDVQTIKGQIDGIAETVGENAQSASQSASSASQSASSASQSVSQAEQFKNQSETNVTHYPKVVDGYWYVWDASNNRYVNTNVDARGVEGKDGEDGIYINSPTEVIPIFVDEEGKVKTETVSTGNSVQVFKGNTKIEFELSTFSDHVGNLPVSIFKIDDTNWSYSITIRKGVVPFNDNEDTLALRFLVDGKTFYRLITLVKIRDGVDGVDGEDGSSGVYMGSEEPTDEDVNLWIDTNGSVSGIINDVQIDGNSVVNNGVANVPIGTNNRLGVVQGYPNGGTQIDAYGHITTYQPYTSEIKSGATSFKPITPSLQHTATFYGLAKAAGHDEKNSSLSVGTYTEDAKSAISKMLNGSVSVRGTTPTIVAKSGIRYVCGEILSLDFTPSASGICDVVFTSGSTATVLTVPSAVKWANGFDPTSLDANTTYELNVMDGLGVAVGWT